MKIVTARQFSRNSATIAGYLQANPQEYIVVDNRIDVRRDFVCLSIKAFGLLAGDAIRQEVMEFVEDALQRQKTRVTKMGKTPKKCRIATNDNAKRSEKVSSIVDSNVRISSIGDFVSGYSDLAS